MIQGPRPTGPILEKPPLLAIEILSPDDKPLRVDDTIEAWLEFGVPHVWVIDPETLESALHTRQARERIGDGVLRIAEAGIEVPLQLLDEDE